jgi:hypothetical protein
MRAQISQSRFLSELDQARSMARRCEAKRDAAGDPESVWYYEQCRRGWVRRVWKLQRGNYLENNLPTNSRRLLHPF